mmetsp:Transcript_60738/g.130473  ORF Transcript_60738/g.130473 Transcript_60738/m.130473 type:complete len:890 (-) Transcript_60738:77-2746(-)
MTEKVADEPSSTSTRRPHACIVFLSVLAATSAGFAYHFDEFKNRPLNPVAAVALDQYHDIMIHMVESFPHFSNWKRDGILIWCDGCDLRKRQTDFDHAILAINSTLSKAKAESSYCDEFYWLTPEGLKETPISALAFQSIFMSRDGSAAILPTAMHGSPYLLAQSPCFVKRNGVVDQIAALDRKHGGLRINYASTNVIVQESITEGTIQTIRDMWVSLPIMAFIMIPFTGNCYRAIIPVVCWLGAVLGHRAFSVVIKMIWPDFIFSLPDAVAIFIELALALDYSLLFWRRFMQERRIRPNKEQFTEVVTTTLNSAGHVIAVSAGVVFSTFFFAFFYPCENSLGILAMVLQLAAGVLCVGFYSIILNYSLTMLLPSLFDEWTGVGPAPWWKLMPPSWLNPLYSKIDRCSDRFFGFLGYIATHKVFKFIMPLIVVGAIIPFLVVLGRLQLHSSSTMDLLLDRASPQYEARNALVEKFKGNPVEPLLVVISMDQVGHVDEHFSALQVWYERSAVQLGGRSTQSDKPSFHAHDDSWNNLQIFDYTIEKLLFPEGGKTTGRTLQDRDVIYSDMFRSMSCRYVESVINMTRGKSYEVDRFGVSMVWWDPIAGNCSGAPHRGRGLFFEPGTVLLSLRPKGSVWDLGIDDMVNKLNKLDEMSASTVTMEGTRYRFGTQQVNAQSEMSEQVRSWQKRAAIILPLTIVFSLGMVGLSYSAVVLPFKLLLTVILPLAMEIAVLFLFWEPRGGIDFRTLFINAGFCFGLAIDYDLFLFSRVYERRSEGYDNDSAVRLSMLETGSLINIAGFVMCLGLIPLCRSSIPWIQQQGFFCIFGVAVDTIVVRTMLAPPVLAMSETLNFWPCTMPSPTKDFSISAQGMLLSSEKKDKVDSGFMHSER